jgi:hypothetical protein
VGLVGWVEDSMTIFDLVRNYRKKFQINIDTEMDHTYSMTPNFDELGPTEKLKPYLDGCAVPTRV